MSERPILFNTPMVRAILEGRKTQTRRVVKVNNPDEWEAVNNCRAHKYGAQVPCYLFRPKASEEEGIHYPRYGIGDILWVRETWCQGKDAHAIMFDPEPLPGDYLYKADFKEEPDKDIVKWRPSVHMPREAARIFLRVKNVQLERLQDISGDDARAEGFEPVLDNDGIVVVSAKGKFRALWDGINTKRGYGWDTNPWVWVIVFERVKP